MNDLANKYDGLLSELAKLLVPHLVDQLMVKVDEKIFEKLGDLKELDDEHIRDIIRSELQDCDLIDEDKAREIADEAISEMDFDTYQFADAVKDAVRNMDFVVEIKSASVEVQ